MTLYVTGSMVGPGRNKENMYKGVPITSTCSKPMLRLEVPETLSDNGKHDRKPLISLSKINTPTGSSAGSAEKSLFE
jgi:hypothetical protein